MDGALLVASFHRSGTLRNMRGSYAHSNFLTLYGSTIT